MTTSELLDQVPVRPRINAGRNTVIRMMVALSFCMIAASCDTLIFGPVDFPDLFQPIQPIARFSFQPESPLVGQVVTFDAGASSTAVGFSDYNWDFGDGSHASVTSPTTTHIYEGADTYLVMLTVTDLDGNTAFTADSVTVSPNEGACGQYVGYFNALPCVTEPASEDITCHDNLADFCTGVETFYACWIENVYCNDAGDLVRDTEECDSLLDCP